MASFRKHGAKWEYRQRYKDPYTQKFKEKSQRGFSTKAEAKLAADDFLKALKLGYEQGDTTLIDYLRAWVKNYKEGVVRSNTLKLHLNSINNHIEPYFQKLLLKDLKPNMYQAFLDHLIEKDLSRRTVEIINSTLYSALEQAVVQGKLERNPAKGSIIKAKPKKRAVKFMNSEDIPRFLQEAHRCGYIYWIFFKILIETGMRKGEAAALKWSDINFNAQTVRIDETLDFQAGDGDLFGDTKTINSERTIKISSRLINELRYHANWQNQNKLNLSSLYKHDLNLVLCRIDGNYMPKSSLYNAFDRICRRAEIPKLPIHSLRHTCAVLHLEAKADMKYVQELLGHGSIQITSDVYSHISKKIEQRNSEQFEQFTSDIMPSYKDKN